MRPIEARALPADVRDTSGRPIKDRQVTRRGLAAATTVIAVPLFLAACQSGGEPLPHSSTATVSASSTPTAVRPTESPSPKPTPVETTPKPEPVGTPSKI